MDVLWNEELLITGYDWDYSVSVQNLHKKINIQNFSIKQVDWEEGWEPYVLLKKAECPLFNQRFLGRIKDKVSFIAALHYLE